MGPFSGHIRFIFAGELTISLDDKRQKVAPAAEAEMATEMMKRKAEKDQGALGKTTLEQPPDNYQAWMDGATFM